MTHEAKIKILGFSLNFGVPLYFNILETTVYTRELAVETFRTMHLENFPRHVYYPISYTEINISQIQKGSRPRLSREEYIVADNLYC